MNTKLILALSLSLSLLLLSASKVQAQAAAAAPPLDKASAPATNKSSQPPPEKPPPNQKGAADGTPTASEELPKIDIVCVRVIDHEALGGFIGESKNNGLTIGKDKNLSVEGKEGTKNTPPNADDGSCKHPEPGGILVGTGDVVVSIKPESYIKMVDYQAKKGVRAALFINGVNLKADAVLVSTQRLKDEVHLRYNIRPGDESRLLWSSLYRTGATYKKNPMTAGLGWNVGTVTDNVSQLSEPLNEIAITDEISFCLAIAFIVVLVAFSLYLGIKTDIFRDVKTPAFILDAKNSDVFKEATRIRNSILKASDETSNLQAYESSYQDTSKVTYTAVAQQALDGTDITTLDKKTLVVGLVLLRDKWNSARSTYSLGRAQLGMWFLFAVATASYLWIIYGDLPGIEGSLLALLGLSLGVTGMSLAVDQNNGSKITYRPSSGLLKDLVTDWDNQQQVHRFQAVVVNLLLLTVGIIHVLRFLAFPIFDATWLAFLGISGVALAAGKSTTEQKPAPK